MNQNPRELIWLQFPIHTGGRVPSPQQEEGRSTRMRNFPESDHACAHGRSRLRKPPRPAGWCPPRFRLAPGWKAHEPPGARSVALAPLLWLSTGLPWLWWRPCQVPLLRLHPTARFRPSQHRPSAPPSAIFLSPPLPPPPPRGRMGDNTSPISVILVSSGSRGNKLLFRYPFQRSQEHPASQTSK